MRTICFLLLLCGSVFAQPGTVHFKAIIKNRNSDTITISKGAFTRTISVNRKGEFDDKFEVVEDIYNFYDGTEYTSVYLKPGYKLTMTTDASQFDEALRYRGKGEKESNYLAQKALREETMYNKFEQLGPKLTPEAFTQMQSEFTAWCEAQLKAIDPGVRRAEEAIEKAVAAQMETERKAMEKINEQIGTPVMDFEYENIKGGTTKLSDLRGKYVYLDVWATWCAPCRAEIPYLKELEHAFAGKDIAFVSISVDQLKDYEKWRAVVTDQQLGGVQLFADKAWASDWVQALRINAIPRFILIGPDGVMIDPNATRPSDQQTRNRLAKLLP